MSDLEAALQRVQDFGDDDHWLCPRQGSETRPFFPEDLVSAGVSKDDKDYDKSEMDKRIEDAAKRKADVLDALQVFGFGDEAQQHKQWIEDQLEEQLNRCEICVREYHRARSELKQSLESSDIGEDAINEFLSRVDEMNLRRLSKGLDRVKKQLEALPEGKRGPRALDREGLFAIFEALNCIPFLSDESLLEKHFDQPFSLVTTKRPLKLQNYPPAVTYFLFGKDEKRKRWAEFAWSSMSRNITASEFEWSVRQPLFEAMLRVQLGNLDEPFLPQFWSGMRHIVSRLDKDLISQSLRSMDLDACKLAFDLLQIDSDGFPDLLGTMKHILTVSPADFWDALGTTPPMGWIEQFFNSRALKRWLRKVKDDDEESVNTASEIFAWINPFWNSLQAAAQSSTCSEVVNRLVGGIQETKEYSSTVKRLSKKIALEILRDTVCNAYDSFKLGGRPMASSALETVEEHLQLITTEAKAGSDLCVVSAAILKRAIGLDCKGLVADRDDISEEKPSQHGFGTYRVKIWQNADVALGVRNVVLARQLVVALDDLVGVEWYITRDPNTLPKEQESFNKTFEALNGHICDVLSRISEYSPADAKSLFKDGAFVDSIFALMSSSSASVRLAALEVVKNATENTVRKEAIGGILQLAYVETLNGLTRALNVLARDKTYAPASSVLRIANDIFEALCDSQSGLLRSRDLTRAEAAATHKLWSATWNELTVIFRTTETWNLMGHDRTVMAEFCSQTMVFAGYVFHQFGVFRGKLHEALESGSDDSKGHTGKALLSLPQRAAREIVRWLRLKDSMLLSSATKLVADLLVRMKEFDTSIEERTLEFIHDVVQGKNKTNLTLHQKAELERAMETHQGFEHVEDKEVQASNRKKYSNLDKAGDVMRKFVESSTQAANKVNKEQRSKEALAPRPKKMIAPAKTPGSENISEFKKKREEEMARLKKEKEAALAQHKKAYKGPQGVQGKDHSLPKGEGMMVSSSESESDEDLDEELFGSISKKTNGSKHYSEEMLKVLKKVPQGPFKKQRLQRSMKDMRARLIPNLSPLHKQILSWEFFHDGPYPPGSTAEEYRAVLGAFPNFVEYKRTFMPLLVLEAWNGFLKAKEENTFKPYDIKVANRASVDAFVEMSSVIPISEGRELSEGDIILLSKSKRPAVDEDQHHCLSRIFRMHRNKGMLEVSYRAMPGSKIMPELVPGSVVCGQKIMSIIPLEREFGALEGLQHYDLCDEISRAKPSPILKYSEHQIQNLIKVYKVNEAQAKAVKSAIDNDAFTLIQGPPGSGKTKTIVAIVGALVGQSGIATTGHTIKTPGISQAPTPLQRKMLVCAPSNAAVDELVMRFKEGIQTVSGEHRKLNILRIGRSDAINVNVLDVTLEELVKKRSGSEANGSNASDEVRKIMAKHKEISAQLRDAQSKMDSNDTSETRKDVADLRRSKALLSEQIDAAKDKEKMQQGQASANERKIRQTIVDESHIICATLSGSGHDMFQNLNVEFETVIIDEAAQCVELSALIPLKYGCAKCVLVGDPQQLPPTVFSKEAARFKYEQSLFVRMQGNHPKDVHLLDTQYRMHPEISTFPSRAFYDSRLKDGPNMAKLRKRPWHAADLLGPYRFFDVQGQHEAAVRGHSLINKAEINVAMALYRRLRKEFSSYDFKNKIGIITPYKSQLRELKNRFGQVFGQDVLDDVEFNTTDAFQGRESEIIIFSCVRASPSGGIGFLQDIRRMNVGLTRAKASLWVLGNSHSLIKGEYWKMLVDHSRECKRYTEGDIEAMFNQTLRRSGKVEEYDDEDMADVSEDSTTRAVKKDSESNGDSGSDKSRVKMVKKEETDHDRMPVKRRLSDDSNEQPSKRLTPAPSSRQSPVSHEHTATKEEVKQEALKAPAGQVKRVKPKPLQGAFGFGGSLPKGASNPSPVGKPPAPSAESSEGDATKTAKRESPVGQATPSTSDTSDDGKSTEKQLEKKEPDKKEASKPSAPPVYRRKKAPVDPFIRRKPGTRPG